MRMQASTTFLFLVLLILSFSGSNAFRLLSRRTHSAHTLHMSMSFPTKIKNVISKMTESTQSALQSRTSRMEIELPPGADFGVEASSKQASRQRGTESNADRVKRSNREAARLVAEMFSSISSTTVALFPSELEANDARIKWGPTFRGQVFSIDAPTAKGYGKLHSRRGTTQEREAALLGSDGIYIPDGTEVIIVVGPRSKDIKKLRKVHEKVGDDTLIIMVNGRASVAAAKDGEGNWIDEVFASVFNYAPPALSSVDRELLLYHQHSGPWYLAEKEKENKGILGLGGSDFKTLWEGDKRPTSDELKEIVVNVKV